MPGKNGTKYKKEFLKELSELYCRRTIYSDIKKTVMRGSVEIGTHDKTTTKEKIMHEECPVCGGKHPKK